jgi:hypothetical protein
LAPRALVGALARWRHARNLDGSKQEEVVSIDTITDEGRRLIDSMIEGSARASTEQRDGIINHFRDEDAVARALSITLTGDDASRQQYAIVARKFLDEMEKLLLTPKRSASTT